MPKQQQHTINLLIIREVNSKFGDIYKAIASLDYRIKISKIDYDVPFDIKEGEEITCFSGLQGSLSNGELTNVPDFLKEHVSFYEQALRDSDINGIFIPPSVKGVMFKCMYKPIDSMFNKITPPDEQLYADVSYYTDLIKEASIVLAARQLGIPVLGSCHGAQLLWYMHGGELLSMPKYTSSQANPFRMSGGMLMNPDHNTKVKYPFRKDKPIESDGYESDPEEIEMNDYNHNLLMATTEEAWPKFNAKKHPCMLLGRELFFPPNQLFSSLPRFQPRIWPNQVIARSFTFPGCTATQWHPHKSLQTKSARHYLHLFANECLTYQKELWELETSKQEQLQIYS